DSITFGYDSLVGSNSPQWQSIVFDNPDDSISFLKYCKIIYGRQCIITAFGNIEIRHCSILMTHGTFPGVGIFCWNNSICKILNNYITCGYWAGEDGISLVDNSEAIIKNNVFWLLSDGIITQNNTSALIDSNIFLTSSQGIKILNSSPTSEIKIRWNVFENIRRKAISTQHTPGVVIYNNNFVNNHFSTAGITLWYEGTSGKIINNISKNNGEQEIINVDPFISATSIKRNNLDEDDSIRIYPIDSLENLGNITIINENRDSCDIYYNLFMDPCFADTINFFLSDSSPCINAGDPSLPWDPDSTMPDIGAHFYDTVTVVFTIALNAGWNMVSIPIRNINTNINSVFPDHLPYVWTFNTMISRYISIDRILVGAGYFVFYPFDTTLSFRGIPVYQYTDTLSAGWHIIGAPWSEDSISVDSKITIPPGSIIEGSLYSYDNESREYISEESIIKPNAYWILLENDCIIRIEGR
ncbi:hypothetical protein JXI42_11220, partial [bacterium]|nr:hypothetical protein [bacterium]